MTSLNQPPSGQTFDWANFKDWLFKLWKAVQNFDITAAANGNTQINGNLTVTGNETITGQIIPTGGIAVPPGANLTGMPLSILAAAGGEQDGGTATYLGPTVFLLATNTSGQSIPNSASTTITGWTTTTDTASAFNASTGVYTIPTGGLYLITASILMNGAGWPASGELEFPLLQNGSIVKYGFWMQGAAGNVDAWANLSIILSCKAGDTFLLQIVQFLGVALTIYSAGGAAQFNQFNIIKLAGG